MLLTTWGVNSLKQFHTIILKSMNQNHKSKTQKTPRALNFINQFASGHQLIYQTQQYRIYNCKGKL